MPPSNTRVAGELHLSGSRDKVFVEECQRKWAWQHIEGFHQEETDAHRFGTATHLVGEKYLGHGTPPDRRTPEGALYLTGVHLWPGPRRVLVEQPFEMTPPGYARHGQRFTGTKDIVKPIGVAFPGFDKSRDLPGVGDYKTTKELKYIPTVEALRRGTQFSSYLHHEIQKHSAKAGAGRWVYYIKSVRMPAIPVDVIITAAEATGLWHQHEDAMGRMIELWQRKADPLTLPPRGWGKGYGEDWEACEAYGGCAFREMCLDRKVKVNLISENPGDYVSDETPTGAPVTTGSNSKLFAKFANKKPEPATPIQAAQEPAVTPPPEATEAEHTAAFDAASGQDETGTLDLNPVAVELTAEQEALVVKHEAEVATAAASKAAAKTAPKLTGAPKAGPKIGKKIGSPSAAAMAAASTMVGEFADGRDVEAVASTLEVRQKPAEQQATPEQLIQIASDEAKSAIASVGQVIDQQFGTLLDMAKGLMTASTADGTRIMQLEDLLSNAIARLEDVEGSLDRILGAFKG